MPECFVFESEDDFRQAVREEVASMLGCSDSAVVDDKFRLLNLNVPYGPTLSGGSSLAAEGRGISMGPGQKITGDDGGHPSLVIDIDSGTIQCRDIDQTTLDLPPEE